MRRKRPKIISQPLFMGKNKEKKTRIKEPIADEIMVKRGIARIING